MKGGNKPHFYSPFAVWLLFKMTKLHFKKTNGLFQTWVIVYLKFSLMFLEQVKRSGKKGNNFIIRTSKSSFI